MIRTSLAGPSAAKLSIYVKPRIKEFEIPLTDQFYVAVEIESSAARITGFVVRLMEVGGPDVNIARYDTADQVPRGCPGAKEGPVA